MDIRRASDTLPLSGKLREAKQTPLDQWAGATASIEFYRKSDKSLVTTADATLDVTSYPILYNFRGAPNFLAAGSYYYILVVTLADGTITSFPNDKTIYDLVVY